LSLRIALAVAGILVLAALLLHGVWQARRREIRRSPRESLPLNREPSLADLATGDTGADGPGLADENGALLTSLRAEPTLTRRVSARPDALIDAIATISVEAPVAGETVLVHAPAARRAGSKPLLLEALNADSGDWEQPLAGQRYTEFQAGVQLANRGGALNEIEYSEFVHKVQAFADALGGLPDFPDMLEVVARARELDAFAGPHDAQLALRLVSRGAAWSPRYVQQHASPLGFVPGVLPGRLVLPSREEGAPPVLSLQFEAQAALAEDASQAAVRELTLAFDVPQTASAEAPFATWCAAAEALAASLDAALFDDGGQPLQPAAFPAIGGSLEQLYAALAERELAAGSAAARRLFS
jgi:hypothetical protein